MKKFILKNKQLVIIILSFVLGIVLGLLSMVFNENVNNIIYNIFNTSKDIILNLIIMSCTIVVFLSIASSIYKSSSIESFKLLGKKLMIVYIVKFFFILTLILFVNLTVYKFQFNNVSSSSNLDMILNLIKGIFPTNILSCFIEPNFIQIVFLAIVFGLAILVLNKKVNPLITMLDNIYQVTNKINDWFSKLIPLLIFLIIPITFIDNTFKDIVNAWIPLVIVLTVCLFGAFVNILAVSIKCKIKISDVYKSIINVSLKGLLTGSSVSLINELKESTCKLNVSEDNASFACPLGLIISCTTGFSIHISIMFFLLNKTQQDMSISLLLSLIITCLMLTLAAPPSSGGTLAISAILLKSFEIDLSYLAIISPIVLLLDYFNTAIRCVEITTIPAIAYRKEN